MRAHFPVTTLASIPPPPRGRLLALVLLALAFFLPAHALAQDDEIEEIVVKGIRGSLESSTAIKRDESGVVDAITAEDLGRFPDTNLAESLQRIPGVSIDRRNNEGNRVSVRGFGPSFNMVTLNGRQMPAAATQKVENDNSEAQSRAFNFAEIASEAVSSVRVYKTGRANVTTGGLGATLDILTAKPLDFDGLVANAKFKLNSDLSNETGDDFTPEFSGIIGNSWGDGTFGLLFNGSYSRRDSREDYAATDGWLRSGNWDRNLDEDEDITTAPGCTMNCEYESYAIDDRAIDRSLNPTGQIWLPRNLLVAQADHERERINAQITAQWAPTDRITATVDWTYSEYEDTIEENLVAMWIAGGQDGLTGTTDSTGSVTELTQSHVVDFIGNSDLVHTENDSFGLNLDWRATDNLSLKFDYHSSTSEAQPGNTSNDNLVILTSHTGIDATTVFGGGIPTRDFADDTGTPDRLCFAPVDSDTRLNRDVLPHSTVDCNGVVEIPTRDAGGNVVMIPIELDDGTFKMRPSLNPDGTYMLDEEGEVIMELDMQEMRENFQVPLTDLTVRDSKNYWDTSSIRANIDLFRVLAVQNDVDQFQFSGEWENESDSALRSINFGLMWTDYQIDTVYNFNLGVQALTLCDPCAEQVSVEASHFPGVAPHILVFNAQNLYDTVIGEWRSVHNQFDVSRHSVSEETTSAYVQFDFETEFNEMPLNALVGVRYEETDVVGTTLQTVPIQMLYLNPAEFRPTSTNEPTNFSLSDSYALWLPSMDVDLEIRDDLIARFSYGRTLARPDLNSLRPVLSISDARPGGPYNANRGNPGLLPYVADNLDLSLEWYYDEGSYFAVSYFKKWVDNYVVTNVTQERIMGAPGELGLGSDENYEVVRTSNGEYLTDPNPNDDNDFTQGTYGDPTNPDHYIVEWDVATPANGENASVDGFEVALQHLFGDTGFGLQANWTVVDGDVEVDPFELDSTVALTGLSDSANLVAFYEKNGIQVRLAYTWRDEYLLTTNQLRQANEPVWVEAYSQFDLRLGYTFAERWTVFLEGINITEEDVDTHGRFDHQFLRHYDQSARYSLGVQASF